MADDYSLIAVPQTERVPSSVSGTPHIDLVAELGCTEMRPKVWFLSPGDEMSFHRQEVQEEVYYVLAGPARIRIGEEQAVLDVETGTAIRIPPETPRQILNDTEGEHVWLIIGAPPAEDDGIHHHD